MAELTGFSYHPGHTILHRMDVRFKLISLVVISIACLDASSVLLLSMSGLLGYSVGLVRVPFASITMEIRYFFFLLLMVFVARALSETGAVVWAYSVFSITREGLINGGLFCWRLTVILIAGLIFVTTTRPSTIKTAVEWFLAPVPGIPEKKAATMLSLIVRFIPLIFYQARNTADAQRARCVESRKNPIYRLIIFLIPLLRNTFESADKLAVAMEARCYNEERTTRDLTSAPSDWMVLCIVLGFVVLAVVL